MKIGLPGRRSGQLRDQRGAGGGGSSGMGGMGALSMLPLLLKGGSPIAIVVMLALFLLPQLCSSSGNGGFGGIGQPYQQFPGVQQPAGGGAIPASDDPDADLVDFVSFVLDDTQAMWAREFERANLTYEPAELVLFTDETRSGCGAASAATGPFYCPPDQTVYIDLGFFRELQSRFDAPGDFAQAYVIAHEIGHHVQNLTGTAEEVARAVQRNPDAGNELSVRQELQADCLAGVWAFSTFERGLLEDGDLEEGLTAAAAVGDDRIQREATGRVNPESFTHGTSEQRQAWFNRGYDKGDPSECDSFKGDI